MCCWVITDRGSESVQWSAAIRLNIHYRKGKLCKSQIMICKNGEKGTKGTITFYF